MKLLPILGMSAVLLTAGMHANANPVSVGAILPLTGASASIGEDQRRGIEMAVERVNAEGGVLGNPLRVIMEDSGGSATTALTGAKKLVAVDKVPVVMGEYSSGITIPVAQYVIKEGVSHFNIGSSSPKVRQIGEGSYSMIGLDDVSAKFAAEDAYGLKYRKVAMIAPNNAYGQGVSEEFKKSFEALGGEVVVNILYTAGQSTYRRELQQLEKAKPDLYVYSAYGQEAAVINREAFELGLTATQWYGIYLTMCTTDTPAQVAKGQIGIEVSSTSEAGKFYEEAYRKKYGEPFKSAYSGYAYDAVMMTAAAINKANSADPGKLREQIKETGKSFNGVTGEITFDNDRQRLNQPYRKVAYNDVVESR